MKIFFALLLILILSFQSVFAEYTDEDYILKNYTQVFFGEKQESFDLEIEKLEKKISKIPPKKIVSENEVIFIPQIHFVELDGLKSYLSIMFNLYEESRDLFMSFEDFLVTNSILGFDGRDNSLKRELLSQIYISQLSIYLEIVESLKELGPDEYITVFSEGCAYYGRDFINIEKLVPDLKNLSDEMALIIYGASFLLKKQYSDKIKLVGTSLPFLLGDKTVEFEHSGGKSTVIFEDKESAKNVYSGCLNRTTPDEDKPYCNRLLVMRQREANALVSMEHYLSKYSAGKRMFLIYGARHVFSVFNNKKISFKYSDYESKNWYLSRIKKWEITFNKVLKETEFIERDFDFIYPFVMKNARDSLEKELASIPFTSDYYPDRGRLYRKIFFGSTFFSFTLLLLISTLTPSI